MIELKPYDPPIDLDQRCEGSIRISPVESILVITTFFVCGIFGGPHLLALARELNGLPIAGLPCTPGWREAVHAISYVASLYPVFLAASIAVGCLQVPRRWAYGTAAIPLGFTAYLIWITSVEYLPTGISSISPPPGATAYVCATATVHGLSHVFLVPIGIRIGDHLWQRTRPRIRSVDYAVIASLLVIWTFAIFQTKTSFQHELIRWLSLATAIVFAVRSLQREPEHNENDGTMACTRSTA